MWISRPPRRRGNRSITGFPCIEFAHGGFRFLKHWRSDDFKFEFQAAWELMSITPVHIICTALSIKLFLRPGFGLVSWKHALAKSCPDSWYLYHFSLIFRGRNIQAPALAGKTADQKDGIFGKWVFLTPWYMECIQWMGFHWLSNDFVRKKHWIWHYRLRSGIAVSQTY